MLFTRTIRRTMVFGLAFVSVMMIVLSLSAVASHLSYRSILRDLEYTFEVCPRKVDLVEAVVALRELLMVFEESATGGRATIPARVSRELFANRQADFLKGLGAVETQLGVYSGFFANVSQLPPPFELGSSRSADPTTKAVGNDTVTVIHAMIGELRELAPRLTRENEHEQTRERMHRLIHQAEQQALRIPDYQTGVRRTIDEAREVSRNGLRRVAIWGGVAFACFAGLIVYGYKCVFAPLQRLHEGARRVAQGDFDYRLDANRDDEMGEMARAFNSMTDRFQEIACDLDRQVRERSKQLVRSERLAGIGFLAAGVAHEINNPLSAIAMAAESLIDRMPDAQQSTRPEDVEVARQYLQMMQRESFRCQRITQKLLDFARGNGDVKSRYDLTAIVQEVLSVIQHMSRYHDRRIDFSRTTPCYLEINGPEIQQVVMNLVSNGLEAMNAGGKLEIELIEQRDHVTLAVADDGCGMTPEVIENLFEPFFTQRRSGRGTGLGLSISHRIVSDHGGTIEVSSDGPQRGSTFKVRLPRRATSATAA